MSKGLAEVSSNLNPSIFRIKVRDDLPKNEKLLLIWNPQPSNFTRLATGQYSSNKCFWYFNHTHVRQSDASNVYAWHIYPLEDGFGANNNLYGRVKDQELILIGPEEEWELKPMIPDETSIDESEEIKKVKFNDSMSRLSCQSYKDSVMSEDLFAEGVDDILYEGELMKFKPGFSQNFVSRYVQISLRAFRYFRNQYSAIKVEPIVAFRKRIIDAAVPYKINKASYLKPGSAIA